MKILYLTGDDLDDNSGVSEKISGQIKAWRELGHAVDVLSYETLSWFGPDKKRLPRFYSIRWPKKRLFYPFRQLYSSTLLPSVINRAPYDIIYTRYLLYTPMLSRLSRRSNKLIMEINSDDVKEYARMPKWFQNYNRRFRKSMFNLIDGFVCVSDELRRQWLQWGKPCLALANGVDVQLHPFIERPGNRRPRLFFIGTPGKPWHGLDKIVRLAGRLPQFDFHVIGSDGKDQANLFWHGYLEPRRAWPVLATADAAFSTLALHRIDQQSTSPLKTAQYLAMGLPVIHAYDNVDLPADAPFVLRLENSEDNIERADDRIAAFVGAAHGDAELRRMARRFAAENLDWRVKEKTRLCFFAEVLATGQTK